MKDNPIKILEAHQVDLAAFVKTNNHNNYSNK